MGLQVRDVMNGVLLHADMTQPLIEVIGLIYRNNADAVIVRENGIPQGIITPADLIQVFALKKDPATVKAGEIMKTPLVTVDHNADVSIARDMMTNQQLRLLPVRMDLDIIGLVVANDLLSI